MRGKGIRIVLLIAIFASIGGVAYKVVENLWLMKAREIQRNPLKILDYVPEAALKVKAFHRTKVEGGRKVWEVAGEEAQYLKAEKEAVIKKPRVVFYDKNGQTIEATGSEAHMFFADQEMERMQLKGAIQINYQGFVLSLDEFLYLKNENQVVSPGKVALKGDGLELEGVGMEISLQDEKIRLLRQVRTKLQLERLGNRKKRSSSHAKTER